MSNSTGASLELLLLMQAGQAVVKGMKLHQGTGLLLVVLHNSGKHMKPETAEVSHHCGTFQVSLASALIFGKGRGRRRRRMRQRSAWRLLCEKGVAYPDSLHCSLQLTLAASDDSLGILHVH